MSSECPTLVAPGRIRRVILPRRGEPYTRVVNTYTRPTEAWRSLRSYVRRRRPALRGTAHGMPGICGGNRTARGTRRRLMRDTRKWTMCRTREAVRRIGNRRRRGKPPGAAGSRRTVHARRRTVPLGAWIGRRPVRRLCVCATIEPGLPVGVVRPTGGMSRALMTGTVRWWTWAKWPRRPRTRRPARRRTAPSVVPGRPRAHRFIACIMRPACGDARGVCAVGIAGVICLRLRAIRIAPRSRIRDHAPSWQNLYGIAAKG